MSGAGARVPDPVDPLYQLLTEVLDQIAIRVREECGALCRILAASVKTAGTKLSRLSGV